MHISSSISPETCMLSQRKRYRSACLYRSHHNLWRSGSECHCAKNFRNHHLHGKHSEWPDNSLQKRRETSSGGNHRTVDIVLALKTLNRVSADWIPKVESPSFRDAVQDLFKVMGSPSEPFSDGDKVQGLSAQVEGWARPFYKNPRNQTAEKTDPPSLHPHAHRGQHLGHCIRGVAVQGYVVTTQPCNMIP